MDYACPTPGITAAPPDGGGYVYLCDEKMFALVLDDRAAGFAGTKSVAVDVAVRGPAGEIIVSRTHLVATATAHHPNGPQCGPTCYSFGAVLGGADR